MFQPGIRVNTPEGKGVIVVAWGTRLVVLLDDPPLELEFRTEEVSLDAKATALPEPRPKPPIYHDGGLPPSLRAIESLRFGLVPAALINEMTIGFDSIEKWVANRLPHANDERPTISEVCGPFGSGKSHTMEVIRWIARADNYLTARVEVDGETVSLSDPAIFLSYLWPTLEGDGLDTDMPLIELYRRAVSNTPTPPIVARAGIDRIHDNYATVSTLYKRGRLEEFESDLELVLSSSKDITASQLAQEIRKRGALFADEFILRPMIGRAVDDRPYDFIEALVGNSMVAQRAGYRGIVITIDEFEVEHLGRHWSRIEDLVEVLRQYFRGRLKLKDAPFALFIATVGQEGHAGDALVEKMLDPGNAPHLLKPLRPAQLKTLGKKCVAHYCTAYNLGSSVMQNAERFVESAYGKFIATNSIRHSSGMTRAWNKFLVQLCDQSFGPP